MKQLIHYMKISGFQEEWNMKQIYTRYISPSIIFSINIITPDCRLSFYFDNFSRIREFIKTFSCNYTFFLISSITSNLKISIFKNKLPILFSSELLFLFQIPKRNFYPDVTQKSENSTLYRKEYPTGQSKL